MLVELAEKCFYLKSSFPSFSTSQFRTDWIFALQTISILNHFIFFQCFEGFDLTLAIIDSVFVDRNCPILVHLVGELLFGT